MHFRTFGRVGWRVSDVGHGLWGMGGWTGSDDKESLAALERSIELGCNFFDTALVYGDGRSERLLGQILKRHRNQRLYVATKTPPKNGKWPARPETPLADVFPPDHVRSCLARSLENLGVDRIDLLQLHVWDDSWAGEPSWQWLVQDLKREGLIGAFGLSLNRGQPDNALIALQTGLVDAVQVVYNIFDQSAEDRLFPLCRALNLAVIARVPFDEGALTGMLTLDSSWPKGDFRNAYFTPERLREAVARIEALRKILPAGMSLPELALRFILSSEAVSTVIPGMRKQSHVAANLAASGAERLPSSLIELLREHRWNRD